MTDASGVLQRALGAAGDGLGGVILAWQRVVGDELAAAATPTRLRDGELQVRCTSAAWAQSVNLMEAELLERMSSSRELSSVRRIIARPGGIGRPTTAPAAPPPRREAAPVDAATTARFDALLARIPNDALRAQMRAAAHAILQRDGSANS